MILVTVDLARNIKIATANKKLLNPYFISVFIVYMFNLVKISEKTLFLGLIIQYFTFSCQIRKHKIPL